MIGSGLKHQFLAMDLPGLVQFRLCTLDDKELMLKVATTLANMYSTGDIPSRNIPARPNADFDLLIGELIFRYNELLKILEPFAKHILNDPHSIFGDPSQGLEWPIQKPVTNHLREECIKIIIKAIGLDKRDPKIVSVIEDALYVAFGLKQDSDVAFFVKKSTIVGDLMALLQPAPLVVRLENGNEVAGYTDDFLREKLKTLFSGS